MVNKMTEEQKKTETIAMMLESINADNLSLGIQAGLAEETVKEQIANSQNSLNFMMSNIYDKLKEASIIA
jgi:hypothetical protein